MFIAPKEGYLGRKGAEKLFLLWWPFSITTFEGCADRAYLTDLVILSEIEDPLATLMTMRRVSRLNIVPSQPVEAIMISSRSAGPQAIVERLESIRLKAALAHAPRTPRHRGPLRASPPARRPHSVDEAVSNPITRGVLLEILSSMCPGADRYRVFTYTPVHALVGIGCRSRRFYIFLDKIVRSTNHETYALGNEKIESMLMDRGMARQCV